MESPEDDQLLADVAEAIADGRPIDWADLGSRAGTAPRADRVKQLQVLEALAALHRSGESTVEGSLVPPPVPKLRSVSRPSKKRGSTERIECASHSAATPCCAFIRASSSASLA